MSRAVYLDGRTDNIKCSLGSDVSLIAKVMDLSQKYKDLCYEWTVDGKTLLEELKDFLTDKDIIAKINPKNVYVVTAYDW